MPAPGPAPRLMEIFNEAVELTSTAERAAYLDRACRDDRALRCRVEGLLGAHAQADGFLESPAPAPTAVEEPGGRLAPESPGTTIGPYKLLEQIGEGGMGVVYVAEQTRPVRRKVALKIIKPGMDTKQVVARFEAERQALAMMDHPNIARVLDGGATESGRPYFVMELVRGIPITDYCDREHLSISARLDLFVLVCRAVQHAHQKGIIHRDLKPSNILVTVIDGAAMPKIIDFGVAKATGASLTERTVYTAFHQFVGTPLYMSPEQADVSGVDVDTRSDIFALGVLLYELLTGSTPFDQDTFRTAAYDEIRRIIREQEPPKPSTRISTLEATATAVSANRQTDPRTLGKSIRGDLDWIVMKALEKDRQRRYETANDFAADVMRYLGDKPVEACPPSVRYRFSKYARRNRAALATGALVTLALVAGATVSVWQAAAARRAEAGARQREEESRLVVDYIVRDIFGTTAPAKARDGALSTFDLLKITDGNLAERFRKQPLVEASIRLALSWSYVHIGQWDDAERNAKRAVELRERFLGAEHPDTLEARQAQVDQLTYDGWMNPAKAETSVPLARGLLAVLRRRRGPADSETLRVQSLLALSLAFVGRAEEAEPIATQAEAPTLQTLGPDHGVTLGNQHDLAIVLWRRGDLDRAAAMLRELFTRRVRVAGPFHESTFHTLKNLVEILVDAGRTDEALPLALDAADRACRAFGPCHINASSPIGTVNTLLRRRGDFAGLRDFHQDLIRTVLAIPIEPGEYLRERRLIRLAGCLRELALLPDEVPIDTDLAARAGEQLERFSNGASGRVTLAHLFVHLGRIDLALESLEKAKAHPNWVENDDDYCWLVEALIRARRGELAEAHRLYDKARKRPNLVSLVQETYEQLQRRVEAVLADAEGEGGPTHEKSRTSPRAKGRHAEPRRSPSESDQKGR